MLLRKINSGLSLVCTFLLMCHGVVNSVWMISGCTISKNASILPWILSGVMVVHAAVSIALGIRSHKGAKKGEYLSYSKLNFVTKIQRISGVLLIPFTALHILGTIGVMHTPKIIHAINPPLFFVVALLHATISTSKAFITLGIGNKKLVKAINIAMQSVCAITLVVGVIGFYLYVC